MKRRTFLAGLASGTAVVATAPWTWAKPAASPSTRAGAAGLAPLAFTPLPLGTLRPEGWLARQLRLQADGLSGHLDEFWPDVGQSQWFGGKAEGWERAPYWLDGVIPLAWLLDDAALKKRITGYLEHIVAHQRADGWYAPYPADASAKSYDLWSILLANKAFVQFHEATGNEAVFQAVRRNLRAILDTLDRTPLFGWGQYRWFEGLIPVYHAYERTGEPWLLDLGRKLAAQGFDYQTLYRGHDITVPTPRRGLWKWDKHVVNTAMAIKAYALASRLSRKREDRAFAARMLEVLDRSHGQVTGMFSGDECLSGKNPLQGTELCAVVEALYSLEQAMAVTGDAAFGDRLERIAFNALPAPFSPDMWCHQYDQQVNQVQCTMNPESLWSTNGEDSNLFGLEPNFGCCTANLHQGWPKLAAHLWMRTPDDGLAAIAYAPCAVRCAVRGVPVEVKTTTDYPFRDSLTISVRTEQPVRFPLVLRVPAWAQGATLRRSDGSEVQLAPGTFHRLQQTWRGTAELALRFPMRAKTTRRYNEALAIERGPLVYSLKLGEERRRVNEGKPHRELPHGDFEVRPTTPWNYGLLVDESRPETSIAFEEQPVGARPFSPEGAGVLARVKGRRLPQWRMEHGWAAEVPPDPQSASTPLEEVTLIPYGCTNIRVTEFPRLKG